MRDNRNKTVTLTFYRSELVYDCENYSFVEADIMKEEEQHAKHQVFDIAQDGNVDRVTRVLNLCFAHCVEMCYPFSRETVTDGMATTDRLIAHDKYELVLRVPDDFSATTVTYLTKLIHELMVDWVMQDWMSITKPKSKATWQEKIDALEGKITSAIKGRIRPVRRPLNPF